MSLPGVAPEAVRWAAAVALVLAYVSMCGFIACGQWRARRARAREAASLLPPSASGGPPPWLLAHASQTGFAEQLAWQTARSLHATGVAVRMVALSDLSREDLNGAERALFIVSTSGEGDAPDSASRFAEAWMTSKAAAGHLSLPHLHTAVLALGDRRYTHFCGFGRALDEWLVQAGAKPLFDRVEVDNGDESALSEWRRRLARVAGAVELSDWQLPPYEPWQLVVRRHLNSGGVGGAMFHLELAPPAGRAMPHWESGDLVQVRAPADPGRPREYSVASVPADGRLHLLVRQQRRADGALGPASAWLTEEAPMSTAAAVGLRLRPHGNFRLGDNAHRPLILIGNGSGLAGLRGHLKARALAGRRRNWLIYGERHAAHDFHHRADIEAWLGNGVLERVDLVFSRDVASPDRYVQDRLRARADEVRRWLNSGAAIYVCGSLKGMAAGVDAALVDIVGKEAVRDLSAQGRYRRDVY